MSFAVGSLVKTRGREWVVLPESDDQMLLVRPLGGTEDEVTGILLSLEKVESATFDLPDPQRPGDYRSCRLLRDSVRLGFRSSAGPFRCFGRIAVEPRPYQLVPLLMALKLDPVRILIADDVGVGKTIEACLVARELIDRGEVSRLAVLCPPPLAEQWQTELQNKFHIEAEVVLPSTARRLERKCGVGESLFDRYPYVIVSMDFIKSDRRRDEFLRTCPELVIVDEAHTCAFAHKGRGGRHQRHKLIAGLAEDPNRHLILATATPHSGKEEAFRSVLAFLNKRFGDLPADLSGKENEHFRGRIAQHFVQRRRSDIRNYLGKDTPFPEAISVEETYSLSPDYKRLFDQVLKYARDVVLDEERGTFRQRVRWWSALALLRSVASSPAAAAETLRSRASTADTETSEDADEVARLTILDVEEDDGTERTDIVPGSDIGEHAEDEAGNRRLLLRMAREAESLKGEKDNKLKKATELIEGLLNENYKPIVFCRFIATADYVATELRRHFRNRVEVASVTGTLPPDEREKRVSELSEAGKRVLVCTDCLSEGVNLQDRFDAVMHYDLSWNPTRHEQREGRVDRFKQPSDTVKVITYYGIDNQIDGIVLDVLIRKHRRIKNSLGVSVAVPEDTEQVIEAIFEGLLLREKSGRSTAQQLLPGLEDIFKPQKEELHRKWDQAAEQTRKRSRTIFAQQTIKVEDVAQELEAAQDAVGSGTDIAAFTKCAFETYGATVSETNGLVKVDLKESPRALREAIGNQERFKARFDLPVKDDQIYLTRTHPVVEGLANFVMTTALDPRMDGKARRCGVISTSGVRRRTTALLVRFRYHVITKRGTEERPLLAEDCKILVFAGSPQNAEWLDDQTAESLLQCEPGANVLPDQATDFLNKVVCDFDFLRPHLDEVAELRAQELLDAHRRVRIASKAKNVSYRVEPKLPPDVLGIYMYLPV